MMYFDSAIIQTVKCYSCYECTSPAPTALVIPPQPIGHETLANTSSKENERTINGKKYLKKLPPRNHSYQKQWTARPSRRRAASGRPCRPHLRPWPASGKNRWFRSPVPGRPREAHPSPPRDRAPRRRSRPTRRTWKPWGGSVEARGEGRRDGWESGAIVAERELLGGGGGEEETRWGEGRLGLPWPQATAMEKTLFFWGVIFFYVGGRESPSKEQRLAKQATATDKNGTTSPNLLQIGY